MNTTHALSHYALANATTYTNYTKSKSHNFNRSVYRYIQEASQNGNWDRILPIQNTGEKLPARVAAEQLAQSVGTTFDQVDWSYDLLALEAGDAKYTNEWKWMRMVVNRNVVRSGESALELIEEAKSKHYRIGVQYVYSLIKDYYGKDHTKLKPTDRAIFKHNEVGQLVSVQTGQPTTSAQNKPYGSTSQMTLHLDDETSTVATNKIITTPNSSKTDRSPLANPAPVQTTFSPTDVTAQQVVFAFEHATIDDFTRDDIAMIKESLRPFATRMAKRVSDLDIEDKMARFEQLAKADPSLLERALKLAEANN